MERALSVIEDASAALDLTGSIPCDATGAALDR
jgi:hypothetical protein